MAFDPIFVYGNYAEAALWIALGAAALVKRRGAAGVGLAAALLAFGVSDAVESRTGGWYTPWWLLMWKCAGVAAIVGFGLIAFRSRHRG